jgi:hypothetical protein
VRIVYVSSERPGRRRITASAAAAAKAAAKITAAIVSATASTIPKSKSSAVPRAPTGRAAEVPGRARPGATSSCGWRGRAEGPVRRVT